MKKQRETIIVRRLLPFALILVFAAALLPFFIQSLFNHPAPWDDYSVALLVKEHGYWGFYSHFLQHWNGRYVSTLLQGLNPLAFDNFDAFRFVPMVFMGGFIAACGYFMYRFWPKQLTFRWLMVVSLGYCAIFFAYVRSAVELWYWHSSAVVYATAFIAVWVLLGGAAPLLRGEILTKKEMVIAAILALLLPGISEAVAISVLAFAGAMGLITWLITDVQAIRQKRVLQWLTIAACIGAGLLLYGLLGGTQARMNIYRQSFQLAHLMEALTSQVPIFISWFNNGTLWLFSLITIPFIARYMRNIPTGHFLCMNPWLMLLFMWLMIFISVVPYYLVTGLTYTYVRIENIAFFWFLFFWFANIACWVGYLQRKWQVQWNAIPMYAAIALLTMALFRLYSPHTKVGVAWLTLLNGDAVQYEKDHQTRYQLILQHKKQHPQDTLILPPIDTHMELLMFEELTDNPEHKVSNKDFAKYFGISAVKVQ
jgi:hypothetical protein